MDLEPKRNMKAVYTCLKGAARLSHGGPATQQAFIRHFPWAWRHPVPAGAQLSPAALTSGSDVGTW